MGNVNVREEDGDPSLRSNGHDSIAAPSSDLMSSSPPQTPRRSLSPILFAPQVPAVPLQGDFPTFFNQMGQDIPEDDLPSEQGIPTLITWSHGGNNVLVEGSWDNWRLRKAMHRSGKDHSVLLVLSSGLYRYKFIVDGEVKYIAELPQEIDDMGHVCNLLDVNDCVPENLGSVTEFEAPPSPDSSYGQTFPRDEDFAKEPVVVPPQLHLTVLGMENISIATSSSSSSSPSKPQHLVLNHVFIEKGWASQSMVALGVTHRFHSKYVTVVLYKPLKR